MEDNKILNARLTFSCTQDWNNMIEHQGGKFCNSCEKTVYDMTDKNAAYFIRIVQAHGNKVCARFNVSQLATNPPSRGRNFLWKKWAVAAMVFIGMGSLMSQANAQQSKPGKSNKGGPDCSSAEEGKFIMGDVVIQENPVDHAIYGYLLETYKVPAGTVGRLMVSFNLRKDGTMDHFAANNHLPKDVRDEMLRLIRNAPIHKLVSKGDLAQSAVHHILYFTFQSGKMLLNR